MYTNSGDHDQTPGSAASDLGMRCLPMSNKKDTRNKTRKDMALSAISMNSALADKEFVLSLHHKLHVSTCINKPNDVHKHNQSIIHSLNQSIIFT